MGLPHGVSCLDHRIFEHVGEFPIKDVSVTSIIIKCLCDPTLSNLALFSNWNWIRKSAEFTDPRLKEMIELLRLKIARKVYGREEFNPVDRIANGFRMCEDFDLINRDKQWKKAIVMSVITIVLEDCDRVYKLTMAQKERSRLELSSTNLAILELNEHDNLHLQIFEVSISIGESNYALLKILGKRRDCLAYLWEKRHFLNDLRLEVSNMRNADGNPKASLNGFIRSQALSFAKKTNSCALRK